MLDAASTLRYRQRVMTGNVRATVLFVLFGILAASCGRTEAFGPGWAPVNAGDAGVSTPADAGHEDSGTYNCIPDEANGIDGVRTTQNPVLAHSGTNALVAFVANTDRVYVQRLLPDGTTMDPARRVAEGLHPHALALPQDVFVLVYAAGPDHNQIVIQEINARGVPGMEGGRLRTRRITAAPTLAFSEGLVGLAYQTNIQAALWLRADSAQEPQTFEVVGRLPQVVRRATGGLLLSSIVPSDASGVELLRVRSIAPDVRIETIREIQVSGELLMGRIAADSDVGAALIHRPLGTRQSVFSIDESGSPRTATTVDNLVPRGLDVAYDARTGWLAAVAAFETIPDTAGGTTVATVHFAALHQGHLVSFELTTEMTREARTIEPAIITTGEPGVFLTVWPRRAFAPSGSALGGFWSVLVRCAGR